MESITVNDVVCEVRRRKIKNLYIRVMPPAGQVVVTVPEKISSADVEKFIAKHIRWAKKRIQHFKDHPVKEPGEYVTGEDIYIWGENHKLIVEYNQGKTRVVPHKDEVILKVRGDADKSKREWREKALKDWYRRQLKGSITVFRNRCERLVGKRANEYRIKDMKTKWGSCNIQDKRIWINLQLVLKKPECLEYVMVHELVHLYERHHNANFYALMDKFYPKWREVKKLLNQNEY